MGLHRACPSTSRWTRSRRVPAAVDRAARMKMALDYARGHLANAQAWQVRNAGRHRRELKLAVGDQVLLTTDGLQLRNFGNKLYSRYIEDDQRQCV